MLDPREDVERGRASKVRWYFGLVGLIATLGGSVAATASPSPGSSRAFGAGALVVGLAYLGCAVFFGRLRARPRWLFAALGAGGLWIAALAGSFAIDGTYDRLIPVGLFLLAPWIVVVSFVRSLGGASR